MAAVAPEFPSTPDECATYTPSLRSMERFFRDTLPRIFANYNVEFLPHSICPRPITDGLFRGAFLIDGTYYFIPSVMRLANNRWVRYIGKEGRVSEYRHTFADKPGRATATIRLTTTAKGGVKVALSYRPKFDALDFALVNKVVTPWLAEFCPALTVDQVSYEIGYLLSKDENCWLPQYDLSNYEVDTAADMLSQLFHQTLYRLKHKREQPNFADMVSKAIHKAMTTGRWTSKRTGICERLKISNPEPFLILAQLRRIHVPQMNTKARLVAARQIVENQFGFICPVGSPDGINCGVQLELARYAFIALGGHFCRFLATPCTVTPQWKDIPIEHELPNSYLGISALHLPFINHDQGPRAIFAMMCQRMFQNAKPPVEGAEEKMTMQLEHGQTPIVEAGGERTDGVNVVRVRGPVLGPFVEWIEFDGERFQPLFPVLQ